VAGMVRRGGGGWGGAGRRRWRAASAAVGETRGSMRVRGETRSLFSRCFFSFVYGILERGIREGLV
jgi:hypothetical protein